MKPLQERILRELRGLNALRPLQAFLRERGAASGRSWEEVADAIQKAFASHTIREADLLDFFATVRCSARKSFVLHRLSSAKLHTLRQRAAEARPDPTWGGFPGILTSKALAAAGTEPSFAGLVSCEGGLASVFCSRRTFNRREEVALDAISESFRKDYRNARLVAEHSETFQAFDVAFIPDDDGPLQMRIDAQHLRISDIVHYQQAFEESVISTFALSRDDLAPVNLFPAIRPLYADMSEGKIVELHHDCTTGASRRESMRRKSDGTDLRTEAYHVAGSQAVQGIDPFRISIDWELDTGSTVRATLPGTLAVLHGKGELYHLEVERFPSEAEIAHVIKVISRHV